MLGLPQAAGKLLGVKSTILDLLCISSSRGQSFFILLESENFVCDALMVGFFPNVLCCIFPMFTKLKIVFVLPNDFEERPHPLECC